MFNLIKSIKEKIMRKPFKNESCKHDFDASLKSVINKRFDREARAAENIAEKYDIETLSEQEYRTLLHEESNKILRDDEAEDIREKALLRRIKTLRTKGEIKDAIQSGYKVLKQKVEPSKDISVTDIHIKDKKTGKVSVQPYTYHSLPHDYDRYKVLKKRTYYPYDFPSKEAAYLLPDDLEVSERVLIEDLIEDIVGASHAWGTYRLDSAEAIWNGKKFVVDCRSYDVDITFG